MQSDLQKGLSLKANMFWNSFGSIVYLGCQWLITILVVRLSTGYEDAGALALGMAVSNVFSPIGYFKVRTYQVSDVNNRFSSGDYIGMRILTVTMSLVVMLVYGFATCSYSDLPVVFCYGLFSCGPIIVDVYHGIDQRHMRMDIIGKSLIMRGAFSLICFVGGMVLFRSLTAALLLMTISTFMIIFLYDIRQCRQFSESLRPNFSKSTILELFGICFPMVIALLFSSAAPSIPRQMLGEMYGPSILGIYASVAAPVAIIQMGAQYVYAPLIGVLAEHFADRNVSKFIGTIGKVLLAMGVIMIASILLFVVIGKSLLEVLYGADMANHADLLIPLIICTVITALSWFVGDVLIVIRRTKANCLMYAISFFVSIVLSYFLIWPFESNGVSFALSIGFGAGLLYGCLYVLLACRQLRRTEQSLVVGRD